MDGGRPEMAAVGVQGPGAARELDGPWRCLSTPPDALADPAVLGAEAGIPVRVPGTIAAARRAAGQPLPPTAPVLDAEDHWLWRLGDLPAGALLTFEGLAPATEVWLDGACLARHDTAFRPLRLEVPAGGARRLALCFRALAPRLARRRPGRGPRWRNRLAEPEALRFLRTSLLGRMPGWTPPLPPIGAWRPVRLSPPGGPRIERAELCATLSGRMGRIALRLVATGLDGPAVLHAHGLRAPLRAGPDGLSATLEIPDPPLWWPHTHGTPALLEVAVECGAHRLDLGRVGFRDIAARPGEGFGLTVNGTEVFCRGALWTGLDPAEPMPGPDRLRAALTQARDAGMNMLRVPGYATYESEVFFGLCDELGLLVWHDFQFARFDYPEDEAFLGEARAEAEAVLDRLQGHPSLAVLCGGIEVTQAAAMAGRPPAEWRHALFDQVLPEVAARLRPDLPCLPNAPCSGQGLPFAAGARVAHWFGVGGYLRPPEQLAAAGVRFAAACLAFANPPPPASLRAAPAGGVTAPRDLGAAWDFADVRDHYVGLLFGVAPAALRREDPERWLALGRAAVAHLIDLALATWRADGRCAGALVLMLHDVMAGAGWGLVAADGRPKSALHGFARAARPVQLVLEDGGQDGVRATAINETGRALALRLALLGIDHDGRAEALGDCELALAPRGRQVVTALSLMGRFRDIAHAWRFGPPAFAALAATLDEAGTGAELSRAVLFPLGLSRPPALRGIAARAEADGAGGWRLNLVSDGFAQFVSVDDDGFVAEDDHFHMLPGEQRALALKPFGGTVPSGTVRALNWNGSAAYRVAA